MKDKVECFDKQSLSIKMQIVERLLQSYSEDKSRESKKIAIVIATHNRFSYLLTYIYSVMSQDDISVKFYISDDRSTDQTCEYCLRLSKQYPEILFYHYSSENKGPSCNRKIALQNVEEEFVVFADDDDYYVKKDFLSEAYHSLSCNDDSAIYFASSAILDVATQQETRVILNYLGSSTKDVFINLLFTMPKPPSTFLMMFKLPKMLKMKLIEMEMLNDVSIYLLVLDYFDGYVIGTQEISGIYRVHSSNITKTLDFDFMLINFLQQIKIIKNSSLNEIDKESLIIKHNKNDMKYYFSNNLTTKADRNKLYSMLESYGYKTSFLDKWRYYLISRR